MDGSAFAAFMGISSSLDYCMSLEPLEADSSSLLGCGVDDCGDECRCTTCTACEFERTESFGLEGGGCHAEGLSVLQNGVLDGWSGCREANESDFDAASSVGVGEDGAYWPTRARGRRGGRRQKRVGAEGSCVGGVGAGCSGDTEAQADEKDGDGDLATSIALSALDE